MLVLRGDEFRVPADVHPYRHDIARQIRAARAKLKGGVNPVLFVIGLEVKCLIQKHNDNADILNNSGGR